jgi:hypothetical protein
MTENNTYLKYLKYKHKYLELKKLNYQLNSLKQLGGHGKRKVKTIGNDGRREGMSLQCFWISILDYLRRNGHPQLTLRQLRTDAGLGRDTEHMMFDIDVNDVNGQAIYYNAATRIAEIYNLRIQIYAANRTGEVVLTDSPRGVIGNGAHLVELAQFGTAHFELIDATHGNDYIPAVVVNGTLMKATNIDPTINNSYLYLSECQNMLKILRDQSKVNDELYKKQLQIKNELKASVDLTGDQKAIFSKQHDKLINDLVLENKKINERTKRLVEEISSLMVIISEFENS